MPDFEYRAIDKKGEVFSGISEALDLDNLIVILKEKDLFLSLLKAGEASGHLAEMLDRIVQYLNFQIELRAKVRAALLYPMIVIFTSLAVVAFLVLFILPTFMDVFNSLHVELPLPTRALM